MRWFALRWKKKFLVRLLRVSKPYMNGASLLIERNNRIVSESIPLIFLAGAVLYL